MVVLTMFDDDDSVLAALRAGARGYVLKDADDDELVLAVRTVGTGGAVYSAGVAARISTFFASLGSGRAARDPALAALTESEHRVLAEPETVRNYVSIIFTKVHVADRAQAIVLARQRGRG